MRPLFVILTTAIFAFGSVYAQDAKLQEDKPQTGTTQAQPSLDMSTPEERPYIESPDGSVRLDEYQIGLWNSSCEFFELALEAFDEKDYKSAIFLCNQAIKYAPEEIYEKWSMYMLQGDIYRFMGEYKKARESYLKISGDREYIGVRHAQAIYKIGLSYYDEKDYETAHPYFERVYVAYLKFEYYSSRAYFYDAKNFVNLKKPELALRILREYFLLAKIKDSNIYLQAQALNRELLDI